jgi:Omp85 superfamily domain/WD40-like Beta Propeller Repeat
VTARRRSAAAVIALAFAALARAQPYDPAFRWRTIETAHFRVHHHQGEDALAQEVAREAEHAYSVLTPRIGYAPPGRTEIVVSDDVDDANGSATPLPYNVIRIYAVAPSSSSVLQDYRSWVREVVQHEYTHILHLDRVGGLPSAFNAVFGKLWTPNAFLPAIFIEGLAVTNESEGDPASGRNGSALFDMYARAIALEEPFPRLDQAANPYLEWPTGHVPYLLGGRFMAFLQARYGAEAVAGFAADQGAAVWPWAPSWTGARWFGGKDFPQLWEEYRQAERAYALGRQAWVRTRPVTAPAPLTHRGGTVETPRFSPDGRFIAYHSRDLDEKPGLRRVALDGKDLGRAVVVDSNGTLALRSPREAVVAIGEVHREFRVYDDLWLVDLERGSRKRLTRGARASDPDVSADGRTMVYVRHTGGGTMALVRRAVDGGPEEVLYAHGGAQVFMPRLARDGRVAFELHEGGRRDIAVWKEGAVERVTDDDALDTGPAWTPDGRFLLFASDRGGIFNLYAWESATGALRQVTNLELGALEPDVSPDGKTVAFVSYSKGGHDVATLPLDEGAWMEPIDPPPRSSFASLEPAAEDLPSRRYSPWPTVRPTFWLPLLFQDGAGSAFGALTGGADVLLHHIWTAEAWWSARGREPGYFAFYQGTWSWPRLDLASSLVLADSPGPPDRLQRVWTYADTGLTFTWTRLARALTLRTGWSGTRYETVRGSAAPFFSNGAPIPAPLVFSDGFLSDASADLRYTDARRFVHSISPEEGRTAAVRLRVADPAIGSDYTVSRANASLAQYARIPFTRHSVAALRLAGGLARGSIGLDAPFTLGSVTQLDASSLVPGVIALGGDQLRGYESDAFGGTGFVLGNLELRFPLGAPLLGRSTWPIFLRRVHGAVFADAGETFDRPGELRFAGHPFTWSQLRFSTGAELRLEIVLAYALRTDLRLGFAQPLGALLGSGRAADRALGVGEGPLFYVVLGPSF